MKPYNKTKTFTTILLLTLIIFSCERKWDNPYDELGDAQGNTDVEMITVTGGTFQMGNNDGDSDEQPIHTVTVSDFYIGKYEVTQKQWKEIMGNNPSSFIGDNLPVEQVSWNDIQTFIEKLNNRTGKNYRLPTEAEWEFAARGGNRSGYIYNIYNDSLNGYTYSGSNNIGDVAWYADNSGGATHEVGTKQANELGIYDMSGNVMEWCNDWYSSSYYSSSPENNPQGPNSGSSRVFRGGGWSSSADYCRVASRGSSNPDYSFINIGFRLVLPF